MMQPCLLEIMAKYLHNQENRRAKHQIQING
jgi:hypothetical protein